MRPRCTVSRRDGFSTGITGYAICLCISFAGRALLAVATLEHHGAAGVVAVARVGQVRQAWRRSPWRRGHVCTGAHAGLSAWRRTRGNTSGAGPGAVPGNRDRRAGVCGLPLSHARWSRERRVVGKAEHLPARQSTVRGDIAAATPWRRRRCMRMSIVPATWRTASRRNWRCLPTGPAVRGRVRLYWATPSCPATPTAVACPMRHATAAGARSAPTSASPCAAARAPDACSSWPLSVCAPPGQA